MARSASGSETVGQLSQFLRWWRSELVGLIPRRLRQLGERKHRRIALAEYEGALHIVDESTYRPPRLIRSAANTDSGRADIIDFLRRFGPRPGKAEFGVRLPAKQCLIRDIELPVEAEPRAAQILALDLERSTPFTADSVYTAHFLDERLPRSRTVLAHQIIAKRDDVATLADVLEQAGARASFADAFSEKPERAWPIDLLAETRNAAAGKAKSRVLEKLLVLFIVALSGSALWLAFDRQDRALQELERKTAIVREKALAVRKSIETSEAMLGWQGTLRRRKLDALPLVAVVDELTRLLPDTAWVSDLRLEQGEVEISGFAKSAAGLVQVIEKSSLFDAAALSAPVTYDARYGAERFGIRAKIAHATNVAQAGTTMPEAAP